MELFLAERMQVLHVVFEVIELFEGLGTPFDLASVNSVFKMTVEVGFEVWSPFMATCAFIIRALFE